MSENSNVTPYALAKEWSLVRGSEVKPQMAYNYVRQNLIPSYRDDNGKIWITREDADKFLAKQAAKRAAQVVEPHVVLS